jgi:hypothetical protein
MLAIVADRKWDNHPISAFSFFDLTFLDAVKQVRPISVCAFRKTHHREADNVVGQDVSGCGLNRILFGQSSPVMQFFLGRRSYRDEGGPSARPIDIFSYVDQVRLG